MVRLELPKALAASETPKSFAFFVIAGLYVVTVVMIPAVGDAALAFCFGSALTVAWRCATLELPKALAGSVTRKRLAFCVITGLYVATVVLKLELLSRCLSHSSAGS